MRVAAGFLKPRMQVGSVIEHKVGDDANAARMGGLGERFKIGDGADRGMNLPEVRDVIAVVFQRRGIDRHQPEAIDAEPLRRVVELGGEPDLVAASPSPVASKNPRT